MIMKNYEYTHMYTGGQTQINKYVYEDRYICLGLYIHIYTVLLMLLIANDDGGVILLI